MDRPDAYLVESVGRALQAGAGAARKRSREESVLLEASEILADLIVDAHGGGPTGSPVLVAIARSLGKDLGGRVGTKRNPSGQPDVLVPSLRALGDYTRLAEEAFPPADTDRDL